MKNSKRLLFLLVLLVHALQGTRSNAQLVSGSLRRTPTCTSNDIVIKNAAVTVTTTNNSVLFTTQSDNAGVA